MAFNLYCREDIKAARLLVVISGPFGVLNVKPLQILIRRYRLRVSLSVEQADPASAP